HSHRLPLCSNCPASTTQAGVSTTKAAPSHGVSSTVDTTWEKWMTPTAPSPKIPVARTTASSAPTTALDVSANVDNDRTATTTAASTGGIALAQESLVHLT